MATFFCANAYMYDSETCFILIIHYEIIIHCKLVLNACLLACPLTLHLSSTLHHIIPYNTTSNQSPGDLDPMLRSTSLNMRCISGVYKGIARTQSPTNKNCAPESSTFGMIAAVSPTVVQWKGLTLGEPPNGSWYPLCQVSMLCRDGWMDGCVGLSYPLLSSMP